jgi:predicted HNH restriction endonuclease
MLVANYYAPNRTLTANMMAKAMGYDHYGAANLHYGTLGGLVGEKLGWNPLPEFKVNVLVDFKKTDGELLWIMKPAVAEAIELLKWTEEQPTLEHIVEEDLDSLSAEEEYSEGEKSKRFVNYYERNRRLNIAARGIHGTKCMVCGFDFEQRYGERGSGYIEVHHLNPISSFTEETKVNPKTEMAVVCSNCHRMIHRKKDEVLSMDQIKEIIRKHAT